MDRNSLDHGGHVFLRSTSALGESLLVVDRPNKAFDSPTTPDNKISIL